MQYEQEALETMATLPSAPPTMIGSDLSLQNLRSLKQRKQSNPTFPKPPKHPLTKDYNRRDLRNPNMIEGISL